MIDPDGGRFTYAYDELGRSDWLENPYNERTTFVYDDAGQLLTKTLGNGTRATHIYDEAGRVARVVNLKSDDSVLSQFDYSYDEVGNRISVVESDAARVTWTYDDSYRLVQEHRTGGTTVGWDDLTVNQWDALTADQWDTMQTSVAYNITHAYDPLGNRLVKVEDGARTTCMYDASNQPATSEDPTGVTTFTYDATGNQQLQEVPSGDRTTYTWNIENRLTKAELPGAVVNTMTYNPEGLRVEKQDSTGTTKHIWDGQNILTETDETDTTQAVYTLQPLLYGNLISQRRASNSHYHHHDALGSIVGLTEAMEALTDTYAYQAYGHPDSTTGTTTNPFRWVGGVGYMRDPDTGMYYVRARHYDPVAGQFISEDPIGFASGDVNLLRYVRSNPLRFLDPSGMVIRNCRCTQTTINLLSLTSPVRTRTWELFTTQSCNAACGTGVFNVIGGERSITAVLIQETADEAAVMAMCAGDAACEKDLAKVMNQVAAVPRQWSPMNKCFRWLDDFLENYPTDDGIPRSKVYLDSKIVLAPQEVPTINNARVVTGYDWTFGLVPRPVYYTEHGLVKVTFPNKSVAYFDIGSKTNMGHFGGDDHWWTPASPAGIAAAGILDFEMSNVYY